MTDNSNQAQSDIDAVLKNIDSSSVVTETTIPAPTSQSVPPQPQEMSNNIPSESVPKPMLNGELTQTPVPPEPPVPDPKSSTDLISTILKDAPPVPPSAQSGSRAVASSTVIIPPSKPHKKGGLPLPLVLALCLILLTLPLVVYFISSRQNQYTQTRSCAAGSDPNCTVTPGPYGLTPMPTDYYCLEESCCHSYQNKTCVWVKTENQCYCTQPTGVGLCNIAQYPNNWTSWGTCHRDIGCLCVQERYCTVNDPYGQYQIGQCEDSACAPCGETPGPTNPPVTNRPSSPPTSTRTPTPPPVSCNQSCASTACTGGLICTAVGSSRLCRSQQCLDSVTCICPSLTPTQTPPSSPTPTLVYAQCSRIRVYKGNTVVDPSTLSVSDAVLIAVAGQNAQRARVRVNGGPWTETTTTNAGGEFTIPFTIPNGVTTFTFEAEVYNNGQWQ